MRVKLNPQQLAAHYVQQAYDMAYTAKVELQDAELEDPRLNPALMAETHAKIKELLRSLVELGAKPQKH